MPPSDVNGRGDELVDSGDADDLPVSASLGWDDEPLSLVELVNQLLDKGVVITGEATVSVAGVDLVYLGLNVLLTSVATAQEHGRRIGPDAGL